MLTNNIVQYLTHKREFKSIKQQNISSQYEQILQDQMYKEYYIIDIELIQLVIKHKKTGYKYIPTDEVFDKFYKMYMKNTFLKKYYAKERYNKLREKVKEYPKNADRYKKEMFIVVRIKKYYDIMTGKVDEKIRKYKERLDKKYYVEYINMKFDESF